MNRCALTLKHICTETWSRAPRLSLQAWQLWLEPQNSWPHLEDPLYPTPERHWSLDCHLHDVFEAQVHLEKSVELTIYFGEADPTLACTGKENAQVQRAHVHKARKNEPVSLIGGPSSTSSSERTQSGGSRGPTQHQSGPATRHSGRTFSHQMQHLPVQPWRRPKTGS